jgi:hypothetical protein
VAALPDVIPWRVSTLRTVRPWFLRLSRWTYGRPTTPKERNGARL